MADPSTASTVYIDRLPNEVLYRILSLVAYSSSSSLYVQPAFIVRYVCRRFRMIAYELDIWRDDTFNITHRIEYSRLGPLGELRWLRNVLLDDSLVRCDPLETANFTVWGTVHHIFHQLPQLSRRNKGYKHKREGPLQLLLTLQDHATTSHKVIPRYITPKFKKAQITL